MADEIQVGASLSFSKNAETGRLTGTIRVDMTGLQYVQKTQAVGTVEETLDKGDVGTIGFCLFKNLDTLNYVELGVTDSTVYTLKLLAGEVAGPLRWNGANVLAKADTDPVNIDYLMIEA